MHIRYQFSTEGITPTMLNGFFVGWSQPPNPETHLKMLKQSSHVVLAMDDRLPAVVGFVNAISDGVLAAYIPLVEVLPAYQNQGIGTQLMEHMLGRLRHLYAIDLMCDPPLQAYYQRFGMQPYTGMFFRNYDRQSGQGN